MEPCMFFSLVIIVSVLASIGNARGKAYRGKSPTVTMCHHYQRDVMFRDIMGM